LLLSDFDLFISGKDAYIQIY